MNGLTLSMWESDGRVAWSLTDEEATRVHGGSADSLAVAWRQATAALGVPWVGDVYVPRPNKLVGRLADAVRADAGK